MVKLIDILENPTQWQQNTHYSQVHRFAKIEHFLAHKISNIKCVLGVDGPITTNCWILQSKAKLAYPKTNLRQSKTGLLWNSQFQLQERSLERNKKKGCHSWPYNKKKTWTHRKLNLPENWDCRANHTMRSGEISECRESRPRSAYLEQKLLEQ